MNHLLLSALLLAGACSFRKDPLTNQTVKGHEELYSEPSEPKAFSDKDLRRVVIAATNDLQGMTEPQEVSFRDEKSGSQKMSIGGTDAIAMYFDVLRKQYQSVVLVDAGNIFSPKKSAVDIGLFYEAQGYDALTVGLDDFNLKLPKGTSSSVQLFRDFAKDSSVPLVLSNLVEVKTGRSVEWKGTAPYVLKDVDGVKIGIIGLVPDDVVSLTPVHGRVGLFVEEMLTNTLRQARLLRSLGAEVVVVLTHQGLRCGHELAATTKLPIGKVNFEPRKSGVCELGEALGPYLERLPPGLVDVVVSGRGGAKVANYVNETLVLGTAGKGQSFIYAEFFVDARTRKVAREKTVVHQPVAFCREFFRETNDCFTEDASVDHKERVPAKFLGQELNLAPATASSFLPQGPVNVARALIEQGGDIAFVPPTTKHTQLVLLPVKGKILSKLLEEDFNSASAKNWYPSPFELKKDGLHLLVNGDELQSEKDYSVLTDLEGLRFHRALVDSMQKGAPGLMPTYSWESYVRQDTITTKASAPQRQ